MLRDDGLSHGVDPWGSLLNSPELRPSFRYCTRAFTIWQHSTGPVIELKLLQPSYPLLRSNLAVLDDGVAKRTLPLRLRIQPRLTQATDGAKGIGLIRFEKADRVSDLGVSLGDQLAGTVVSGPEHLDRLTSMLARFGCDVEWSLTTQHLTHDSLAPISDLVWEPDKFPQVVLYDLAATCTVSGHSEDSAPAVGSSAVESITLLSQIRELLKSGIRVRLF